jgi:hypothetical protein
MKNLFIVGLIVVSFLAGRYSRFSPIPETTVKPVITENQYTQIVEGMTLSQVNAVLGEPGSCAESERIEKIFLTCSWSWVDGTQYKSVSVSFIDGVVTKKSRSF